jgi:murein DD-endopeptidase MepM/ murein hydrolase activator NlpD
MPCAHALDLSLPTDNTGIFDANQGTFFMGVDRKGERVWQGGTFGYVRSPLAWQGGTVFTQFHEGIDIAPVSREAGGIASDEVRAISEGTVVLCETRGQTLYGNQVILKHKWGYDTVFSRYAHLSSVSVVNGETIKRGQTLGIMGYTGGALTLQRAHLHLEVALMLQETMDLSWLPKHASDVRYHPANMKGVDATALFLAHRKRPELILPEYFSSLKPYFAVAIKADSPVNLLIRHKWLSDGRQEATGWRISFTEWGLPLRFEPLDQPPNKPVVVWVQPFEGNHAWRSGGLLQGTGETAVLGASGQALMRLIFGDP